MKENYFREIEIFCHEHSEKIEHYFFKNGYDKFKSIKAIEDCMFYDLSIGLCSLILTNEEYEFYINNKMKNGIILEQNKNLTNLLFYLFLCEKNKTPILENKISSISREEFIEQILKEENQLWEMI